MTYTGFSVLLAFCSRSHIGALTVAIRSLFELIRILLTGLAALRCSVGQPCNKSDFRRFPSTSHIPFDDWISSTVQTAPSTHRTSTPAQPPRKRKRPETSKTAKGKELEKPDESDAESPSPRPKSKLLKGSDSKATRLACPFCKIDPHRHRQCLTFAAIKPSHVKQHIYRSHQKPYCVACSSLFDDIESLDAHTRARSCPVATDLLLPPGFISLQQGSELHRRIPPEHATIESQWYHIFDIVCPGHARPASPYNDFVVLPSPSQDSASPVSASENLPAEISDAQQSLTEILLQGFRQDPASFNQYEALVRAGIARGIDGEEFSAWVTSHRSGVYHDPAENNGPVPTVTVQHEPEQHAQATTLDYIEHSQQYDADDLFTGMQTTFFPDQLVEANGIRSIPIMGTGGVSQESEPISMSQLDYDGQPEPSNWNDHYQQYIEDVLHYAVQRTGDVAQADVEDVFLSGYQQVLEPQQDEWTGLETVG